MDGNYQVRTFILNQEFLLDVAEDPYCVIISSAIIYFIDVGYFVVFLKNKSIYLLTFILLPMTRVLSVKKAYFHKVMWKGFANNKAFWNTFSY